MTTPNNTDRLLGSMNEKLDRLCRDMQDFTKACAFHREKIEEESKEVDRKIARMAWLLFALTVIVVGSTPTIPMLIRTLVP